MAGLPAEALDYFTYSSSRTPYTIEAETPPTAYLTLRRASLDPLVTTSASPTMLQGSALLALQAEPCSMIGEALVVTTTVTTAALDLFEGSLLQQCMEEGVMFPPTPCPSGECCFL